MQLSLRTSSKATRQEIAERNDPTLPAILEFQAPSTAVVNAPMPRAARFIAFYIALLALACFAALGLIPIDRVVVAQGKVVSKAATTVVQPLDQAIVRSIDVEPGDRVRAGQVLARLDPTFAAADLKAIAAQVSNLQAQASRLKAEAEGQPFSYVGEDPDMSLQAAIYAQRKAEFTFRMENYQQKINSLSSTVQRARTDAERYQDRLQYATSLENMRRELERLNVGSKINTLGAMDARAEMQRNMAAAEQGASTAQRDLAAMVAERNSYEQNWHAELMEKLAEVNAKLSDARESYNKASLRRQLVELRAETDGTVLSVSKVSVGSVLSSGQQLIALVPSDAPLEVEANIPANTEGYVAVGDAVTLKFDTFSYSMYGMAHGTVRTISADSFTPTEESKNPTGAITPSLPGSIWYRARITLDRVDLRGVPPEFSLMPGMPVTADIKVGKRTVLAFMMTRLIPLATEGLREP